MKSKFFSSLLVIAAVASALSLGLFAKESPAARKAPDLRVDNTPVADGKSGLVSSYADIVEPVQKAVVSVYSKKIVREQIGFNPFTGRLQGGEHKEEGLGSGVIISADGYILTNNHVVEGADELKVLLTDERELVAKVIGADPKTDIAVIKIDTDKLPIVTLADSDKLRVGDVVFAVGNPLGVGQTVTSGIVSAKGRNKVGILDEVGGYENFIQTDAAINMGNSGGALVDAKGRLVGINSAILSPSRGSIGIGFAIPTNLAVSVMRMLIEHGSVVRGYLGVSTDTVSGDDDTSLGLAKETKGVVVTDISPDSPAEKAGLKMSDVILAVNGLPVTSREELRLTISQMPPGTKVKLKVSRKGKEQVIEAVLGKLDENPNEIVKGVDAAPLTPAQRGRLRNGLDGIVVTKVDEDSPYADRLGEGWIIVQIDGEEVADVAGARKLLTPGRHSLLVFYRGIMRRAPLEVK
jgi:serine protease Do/serine protease DegQ